MDTLTGASRRKHALQLQFPRQNGQALAISSSFVIGYLRNKPKDSQLRNLPMKNRENEQVLGTVFT